MKTNFRSIQYEPMSFPVHTQVAAAKLAPFSLRVNTISPTAIADSVSMCQRPIPEMSRVKPFSSSRVYFSLDTALAFHFRMGAAAGEQCCQGERAGLRHHDAADEDNVCDIAPKAADTRQRRCGCRRVPCQRQIAGVMGAGQPGLPACPLFAWL